MPPTGPRTRKPSAMIRRLPVPVILFSLCISAERILDQSGQYPVGFEIFLRNGPCRSCVTIVVRFHVLQGRRRFLQIRKGQQAFPCGKNIGKPGVLYNHGTTCCQVTSGAVTEPAGAHRNVDMLGDGKLAFRARDKILILDRGESGSWPLQDFPSVACGVFPRRLEPPPTATLSGYRTRRGSPMSFSNSLPLLSYSTPWYTSFPLNAFQVITVVQGAVFAGLMSANTSHNLNRTGLPVGFHRISTWGTRQSGELMFSAFVRWRS